MLTRSNKSRLAAMALMALGVTTLMGTSAALATDVTVGGTVGCSVTATTLSAASHPGMGTIALGASNTVDLTFTVAQGKRDTCADKTGGTVTAAMGTTTGSANAGESFPVTLALGGVGTVNSATGVGLIPVTAAVPSGASTGAFGATVTLTLVPGS
jgi:hypothetical protein